MENQNHHTNSPNRPIGRSSGQTPPATYPAPLQSEAGARNATAGQSQAPRDAMSGIKQEVKSQAHAAQQHVRDAAHEGLAQAKQSSGEAIFEGKDRVAGRICGSAASLREAQQTLEKNEPELARAVGSLAAQVDSFGRYLKDNDPERFLEDTRSFGRKNPALFLGGAFAAGIALGRFFRSSGPRRDVEVGR